MRSVLSSLAVFLTFIILCSYCGGLFGFNALGTFSDTFSGFAHDVNLLKRGLIDPLNDFLSFFGLGSSVGGVGRVYQLQPEEEDLIFSIFIPEDARYVAVQELLSLSPGRFKQEFMYSSVFVFFDDSGNPISGFIFDHQDYVVIESGQPISSALFFTSIDVSKSFYNPLSKFVFFDFVIQATFLTSPESIHCTFQTPLFEYKYFGNFQDFERHFALGKGGKF